MKKIYFLGILAFSEIVGFRQIPTNTRECGVLASKNRGNRHENNILNTKRSEAFGNQGFYTVRESGACNASGSFFRF